MLKWRNVKNYHRIVIKMPTHGTLIVLNQTVKGAVWAGSKFYIDQVLLKI